MSDQTNGIIISVGYNKHTQPVLYINKDYYNNNFVIQSIKISAIAYPMLESLLNASLAYIHKEAGVPYVQM